MKKETAFRREMKSALKIVFTENENAKLVKFRYNTLRATLLRFYPNLINSVEKDQFLEMLRAIVYLDRQIRLETEGMENETKEILSQEAQIDLGYTPNYQKDINLIKNEI